MNGSCVPKHFVPHRRSNNGDSFHRKCGDGPCVSGKETVAMAALTIGNPLFLKSSSFTSPTCTAEKTLGECYKSSSLCQLPSFPLFSFQRRNPLLRYSSSFTLKATTTMATGKSFEDIIPPVLDSTSDPPSLFDGTTRLYVSLSCPYAQRAWITRNCKGLQEKIKLVPIDLQNRPAWYKEKVYAMNKVPALEHNNEVKGESLDLIKYIDEHFEGPSLYPDDPIKREFAEKLLSYTGTFSTDVVGSFKGDSGTEAGAPFDYLETALSEFTDGPFFLGQFSLVDIAYAPFIERFQAFLADVKSYDITTGRPKLTMWIEEMNKIEGYKQTKRDPKEFVEIFKKRFMA